MQRLVITPLSPSTAGLVARFGGSGVQRTIRTLGWALIAVQFVGLVWWSAVLTHRASMSWDYGTYYQAWWSIAHGHLDPITTTVPGSFPFWQSDGEFIVWLLAPLYWILPSHKFGFWLLQDFAYTGISIVAFRWIGELLPWESDRSVGTRIAAVAGSFAAACLLVLDPWPYWSASFAVQLEPFAVLFALLGLRALTQNRRTTWLWCALTALCGSAATIYVCGIGLTGVALAFLRRRAARRQRDGDARRLLDGSAVQSLTILVGGIIWLLLLGALHATRSVSEPSSTIHQGLAYLLGSHAGSGLALAHAAGHAVLHPGKVVSVIASHALNLWANTAPGGFVGLLSPVGFFMSAPTLLENSILNNQDFSYPGFSNLIVYPALAVGTALVVATLVRRHPRAGLALTVLVAANAIAWLAVWLPKTSGQYVRIDPVAAQRLRLAAKRIPAQDEVVASQGFVGVFAARKYVYAFGSPRRDLAGPEVFPVRSPTVWFVLSGDQWIEGPSTAATDQALASVAALPGAKLITEKDGIWIFRWHAPAATRKVALGGSGTAVPAWSTAGSSARVQSGPAGLTTVATHAPGYVVSGDIWRLGQGRYMAHVSLSSSARANIEVWSDSGSGDTLLGRRQIEVPKMRTISVPFTVPEPPPAASSTGPAPFAYEPQPPPHTATIEIRVWTPGTGSAKVGDLSIARRAR